MAVEKPKIFTGILLLQPGYYKMSNHILVQSHQYTGYDSFTGSRCAQRFGIMICHDRFNLRYLELDTRIIINNHSFPFFFLIFKPCSLLYKLL